jgi:hypothetical protein
MAEITHAWQSILPHLQAVKIYFTDMRSTNVGKLPTNPGDGRDMTKRVRNTRRHAGSFSLRDVEIGRSMSTPPPPDTLGQDSSFGNASSQQQHPYEAMVEPSAVNVRSLTPLAIQNRWPDAKHLGLPDNSSKAIDRELVETISTTVGNAQRLWELLAEFRDGIVDTPPLPSKILVSAKDITDQLSLVIKNVQWGSGDVGNRQLFEETLSFIKVGLGVNLCLSN